MLKRTVASLLIGAALMLAASYTPAEPKHKHWYTNPKWWAGEAVILGAMAADASSTCDGFHRGFVENNFVMKGANQCNGKFIGWMASGAVFESGIHVLSYELFKNDPSKGWRTTSLVVVPTIAAIGHGTAAIHNYRMEDSPK